MTSLSSLQETKKTLSSKVQDLEKRYHEIYAEENLKVEKILTSFFSSQLPSNVSLVFFRSELTFKIEVPEVDYKKELFSLDLRETWSGVRQVEEMSLSYYTTCTKSTNSFELKRLMILGTVAEIVSKHQKEIVDKINETLRLTVEEKAKIQNQLTPLMQELRTLEEKITQTTDLALRKEILMRLKIGGISFPDPVRLKLKHNVEKFVSVIRIDDISPSKKSVTVSFTSNKSCLLEDSWTTLHRLPLEKLIDIIAAKKDSVSPSLL